MLLALFGIISSYAYYRDPKKKWYALNSQRKDLWLWVGWLVPVAGFFSVASFFHPYYTIISAGGGSGGMGNSQVDTTLLNYLKKHQGNAEYLFATDDSSTAAPYIIKTGEAVMAMGGFNGTDKAITLAQFKKLVKEGKVKYYYSGGKTGGSNNEIVNWIKKHAKKVSLSNSSTQTNNSSSVTVSTKTKTSTKAPSGTAPGSSTKSGTPPAKPSGSNSGTAPSGNAPTGTKPSGTKAPTGSTKAPTGKKKLTKAQLKKMKKSNKTGAPSMGTGAMGGPGQSGTLYDLSSIYK